MAGGQAPPGGGWYVQDPSTGLWFPIEREAEFPNGNISDPSGQQTPHYWGMEAYRNQKQVEAPKASQDPPGITQVAKAPDGVPVYRDSNGQYYTRNPDGSWQAQQFDQGQIDAWNASNPGPGPGPGNPNTGHPGLIDPWGGQFTPPPQQALPSQPGFTPPSYTPPPAFAAPSWEQAAEDPGYQFVQKMGQRGLERSAAARGVLNTGGTLQDIAQWNQSLADTQYQNVFNRNLNTYQTNYATQFADPYKNAYQSAFDTSNFAQDAWKTNMGAIQRANEFNFLNAYDQYKFGYQQWMDRNKFSLDLADR